MNLKNARKVVLVVDDEPILRMHAAMIVEDGGFEAIEAGTADEAIAILQSRSDIGVVLTDVEMPGSMDGLKLMALIRDRWPPIALIIVSGHVRIDESTLPERARFFAKPYPERELLKLVQELAA